MSRMSRRAFITALGCAPLTAMACRRFTTPPVAPGTNIVFILVDDLGWADLPCYGNRFHDTPNIDRLARQGMRFTDAYAAAPVCSPTRASILAGQYPARVGITDFIPGHQRPWAKLRVPVNRQQYLPLETVTIAEALAPLNYATGVFGKWHLGGPKYSPDKQGFDSTLVTWGRHFDYKTSPAIEVEQGKYLGDLITDQGEAFIEANRNRPFFLNLSHYAVHIPLEARQELIEKYESKPKPDSGVNNPIYAAMVEHVDQSVGRILDKLEALNLADRTVVVLMSDNGGLRKRFDEQGPIVTSNAPLRDEKGSLYEGGIREPLLVRWPGVVEPGSVCDEPVSSVDFYPTFLDIAGIGAPDGHVLDGESIVPLLRQKGSLDRNAIFWHYPHYHHSTPAGAIRQGDWKLIEFFEDGRLELYNLEKDLSESHDLAGEMPRKARQLRQRLAAWRASVGAAMPEPNPDHDPARSHEWGRPRRGK